MSITPLPPPPSSSDPGNFDDRADELLAVSLPLFITEANELQIDVTTKQGTASAAATTATEQAAITTTKAGQANTSAGLASDSAGAAATSEAAALAHKNAAGVSAGNAADSEAAAAASAASVDASILRWVTQPIGVPIPFRDDIAGVEVPPTDNPNFRYIKLTAADAYNTGVLTSETVSGSAPLVLATAVISVAGSPINGAVVDLVNTTRRSLRGGNSGTVEQDALQNITGSTSLIYFGGDNGNAGAMSKTLVSNSPAQAGTVGGSPGGGYTISFNAADSPGARTANETRFKNLGVNYYMRVK